MARAPLPEKSFPRGGKKPKKAFSNVDFNFFNSNKSKVTKKKHNKGHVKKRVASESRVLKPFVVHDLAVNDIRPGMLMYGCVDTITDVDVQFSLPGNCRAIVPAVKINQQFSRLIQQDNSELSTLSELFEMGQFLPLVILERYSEKSRKFKASLEPTEINSKLAPRLLQPGFALTGSVASIEEHGYVIDLGISRVTSFLRRSNARLALNKGQLLQVFVLSVSEDHNRIQLTTKPQNFTGIDEQFPVHCFLPGMQAKLMVSQVLKGGLEVYIKGLGPNIKGFIHNNYLPKIFDKSLNYPEGSELDGSLLYVMPLVNLPFFKATNLQQPTWKLSYGDLVENAKVVSVNNAGLTLKIKQDGVLEKLYVPASRTDKRNQLIDGKAKLTDFYAKGKVLPQVRIELPSKLGRFYYAALDRDSLKEPLYSKKNLKVGDKVKCTFIVVGENYCTVGLSKHVKGFVPGVHVTEIPGIDYTSKYKVGQAVRGRVLSLGEENKSAKITLKPSLVKAKILTADTEVQVGDKYPGTICKIYNRKILVEFFGGRVGQVLKENMTLSHHGSTISDSFKIGQVVNCYIISADEHKLALSLVSNKDIEDFAIIGRKYQTIVTVIADEGVYVDVHLKNNEIYPGFIPNGFISNYDGIVVQKKKLWKKGDKLPAVCVYCDCLRNPPILLAVHSIVTSYVQENKNSLNLDAGLSFPCVYIPGSNITVPAVAHDPNYQFQFEKDYLVGYKVLRAKIINVTEFRVACAAKVSQIWDGHYKSSFLNLNEYFNELCEAKKEMKKNNNPLADITLGQEIFAKSDGQVLRLKNGIAAKSWLKVDSKVSGRVMWIDLSQEVVWIRPHPKSGPVQIKSESREYVHAKIVYVCSDVIVGECAGSHEFVYIPTRRHVNDGVCHDQAYKVGESVKLFVQRIEGNLFGIDRKIAQKKNAPISRKRKIDDDLSVTFEVKKSSAVSIDPVKMEVLSDDENGTITEEYVDDSDMEIKDELDSRGDSAEDVAEFESETSDEDISQIKVEPVSAINVGFDWSVTDNPALLHGAFSRTNDEETSSDDEDNDGDLTEKKKRKRLTGAEKKEKAKESEERLRSREMQLIDPNRPPQSADDFDRLVMTMPNNSAIWLQYMAYHLQETEIEKARAVARRALKSISFREEEDKTNVWLALLNLEQLYGDTVSQKSVLEEALRCNEPYKVHLHKLNTLADNGAGLEAEKLANVMLKKYGSNENVWPDVGGVLMKIGKIDFARNVLKRAMASLPNVKHVTLITKFAKLESKYGSGDRAQTLYEHILSAFPKRVDVWSAYVDLMVKTDQIELARQILERSTAQTLPLKKMKTLFKKFIAFEEAHGLPENVERVRQTAAEFVDTVAGD